MENAVKTESKAQHTPGPWTCMPTKEGGLNIARGTASPARLRGFQIMHSRKDGTPHITELALNRRGFTSAEQEANARLIAAAPELLELADLVIHAKKIGHPISDIIVAKAHAVSAKARGGRAAIAKATGKGA